MRTKLLQIFFFIILPLMCYAAFLIVGYETPKLCKIIIGLVVGLWVVLVLYLIYDYNKTMSNPHDPDDPAYNRDIKWNGKQYKKEL